MDILITITALMVLYWIIKNQYQERLTLKYKYKFFALRDKLRQSVIDGRIDKNDWVFDYIDTSISRTVSELDNLNLYSSVMLMKYHKNDAFIKAFRIQLQESLKRNHVLTALFEEYGSISSAYIIEKHILLKLLLIFGIKSVTSTFRWLQKVTRYFNRVALSLRFWPETSSISRFGHC